MNKSFLRNVIIIPAILGVVVCIVFFVFMGSSTSLSPFSTTENMANHYSTQSKAAYISTVGTNTDEISINSIAKHESNDIIGEVIIGSKPINLLYDANFVNMSSNLSLLSNGKIIGEVGVAYIYGYKGNLASDFAILNTDKIIKISTDYGTYQYKCVDSFMANSQNAIFTKNLSVKRGLVIYTDDLVDYGINGKYKCFVFEMADGPSVIG